MDEGADLFAADASAPGGCGNNAQCGGSTPECDVRTGACVECLPTDDHCLGGAFCSSSLHCITACTAAADCYVPDGGAALACCGGQCVTADACADGGALFGSCKELLDAQPGALSGIYTIDLRGVPTQVYCDMATDGGGWTRIVYPQFADADAAQLLGAAGRQMVKCSDADGSNYIISPQIASWSWTPGAFIQVPGMWLVDGSEQFCGNNPEFTSVACGTWYGVGCGNGPGHTNKLFLGVDPGGSCTNRTSGVVDKSFAVCAGGVINYSSFSVYLRAGD